jgi:hypothetical protein
VRRRIDLLHVSLGTTGGWWLNDRILDDALRGLGVGVVSVSSRRRARGVAGRLGSPVLDLSEGALLAHAASHALRHLDPDAFVYSSSTAALLQPVRRRPEALWIDAPMGLIRPGHRNAPLRALERLRPRRLDLVMPMSVRYTDAVATHIGGGRAAALPTPIEASHGGHAPTPAPLGVMYAAQPWVKGLDVAARAWRLAGLDDHRLLVTGLDERQGRAYLQDRGVAAPPNMAFTGVIPKEDHRAAVRSARFYVSASHREGFGTAQLEAMVDGTPLVTVPSTGPCDAVALARSVQPNLVAEDVSAEALGRMLQIAVRMSAAALAAYREDVRRPLAAYSRAEFVRRLREVVVPALLG